MVTGARRAKQEAVSLEWVADDGARWTITRSKEMEQMAQENGNRRKGERVRVSPSGGATRRLQERELSGSAQMLLDTIRSHFSGNSLMAIVEWATSASAEDGSGAVSKGHIEEGLRRMGREHRDLDPVPEEASAERLALSEELEIDAPQASTGRLMLEVIRKLAAESALLPKEETRGPKWLSRIKSLLGA